jgi:hypothetical protein
VQHFLPKLIDDAQSEICVRCTDVSIGRASSSLFELVDRASELQGNELALAQRGD